MNEMILSDAIGMIDDKLIENAKNNKKIKKHSFIKIAAAAAAAVLCISAPLPAATALGNDRAYSLLYNISPGIAQTFKPVHKSCEDNGIKIEVISADIKGSSAEIYISLQDTGLGIDKSIDLNDSYYINCPFGAEGHCSLSEYDENTKTAYFMIYIKTMNGEPIKRNKVTFGLSSLIYDKYEYSGIIQDIDLKNVPKDPRTTENIELRGYADTEELCYHKYLDTGGAVITAPVSGAAVTGIGYIDGALHIQTYYEDILRTDNHGFVTLIDKNGQEHYTGYGEYANVSFWDEEKKGSYDELIIDMPYEEIENYSLRGDFFTSSGYAEGKWQITFSLDDIA